MTTEANLKQYLLTTLKQYVKTPVFWNHFDMIKNCI